MKKVTITLTIEVDNDTPKKVIDEVAGAAYAQLEAFRDDYGHESGEADLKVTVSE